MSMISWVHFGDLHIQNAEDENYLDFPDLIADVNRHLSGDLDFAFLPGDNADDGTEPQYHLVRRALDRLTLRVDIITGDHDRKAGTLALFQRYLECDLYRASTLRGFRLLFLNALDGRTPKEFDSSDAQTTWLEQQLREAHSAGLRPLVFTHLYPSELITQARHFRELTKDFQVELVEMGHTHYKELANDGRTIYAATRSTGQIEEGPPGFSITVIAGDVVSWKFKERGPWPLVMITSPSDELLITRPEKASHVVRGLVCIRAKVWGTFENQGERKKKAIMGCAVGDTPAVRTWAANRKLARSVPEGLLSWGKKRIQGLYFHPSRRAVPAHRNSSSFGSVVCSVNQASPQPMQLRGHCWECSWNSQSVPDGLHSIVVTAETLEGRRASDEISILVNQAGHYDSPPRREVDYENAVGPWESKGIPGTELGPNEKGTKGPWPSWRGK